MRNSSRHRKKLKRKHIREMLRSRRKNRRRRISSTSILESKKKKRLDKKSAAEKPVNEKFNRIDKLLNEYTIENRKPTIVSFENSRSLSKLGDELLKKITDKIMQ